LAAVASPEEVSVSDSLPDQLADQDPLDEFATELRETPTEEPRDPLELRIERLERELSESTNQITSLQSKLATLVTTTEDINKRMSRRPLAPAVVHTLPVKRAPSARPAFLIAAAVVLAISAGVWGWITWPRASAAIAPAAAPPVAAQAPVTIQAPPDATLTLASTTHALAPQASPVPIEEPPSRVVDPERVDYFGTLSIDAQPGGDVLIDRKPAGRTPLRVANLRAGSHLVWIERDGYRRFTRVVQVPADRVTRLSAELEAIPAR
jgi:hypothetical protein